MSARVMNALGASALERTICATAGIAGTVQAHGVSPEVDPEEWPNARYLLVWGWNPLSTAPHLWRKLLDARKQGARLVVVDPVPEPNRAGRGRASAPAPGYRRRARHRHDARGRGRRPPRRGLVPRPRGRLRRAARRARPHERRGVRRRVRRGRGDDRARGTRLRHHEARAAPARRGRPAPRRRTRGVRHRGVAARPHRRLEGARRRLLVHPDGDRRRGQRRTAPARGPAPRARRARSTCPGSARRSPTRELDPPVKAFVCWSSNPASIAPDQERVLEGLRRDDLFTVVLEQFMTDTAQHADVILPATTQLEHLDVRLLVGPPLPDLERARDRAVRRGEAQHRDVPAAGRAARPRRSLLPRHGRRARRPAARRLQRERPARAGLDQDRPRPGAAAARGGRLRHRERPRDAARPLRAARRGGGRGARRALPARARHAKDPPVPQLHLREPAAPALGAAVARGRGEPRATPRRAASRTARRVRVFNDRGSFTCAARVSDDARPGVLVAPMGWWNSDYPGGRSAQATTPQLLTAEGNAPDLQRQPRGARRGLTPHCQGGLTLNGSGRSPASRAGCGPPPRSAARAVSARAAPPSAPRRRRPAGRPRRPRCRACRRRRAAPARRRPAPCPAW